MRSRKTILKSLKQQVSLELIESMFHLCHDEVRTFAVWSEMVTRALVRESADDAENVRPTNGDSGLKNEGDLLPHMEMYCKRREDAVRGESFDAGTTPQNSLDLKQTQTSANEVILMQKSAY